MPALHAKITTGPSPATIDASGKGVSLLRGLVGINLGLVALQALSAGFFLSGYGRALTAHIIVAFALQLGALIQAVTAVVQWRRRRVPGGVAVLSIGLFLMVFVQIGFGYSKRFWLHVPIGVGLFGWLTRQLNRLRTLSHTTATVTR